ncbi:Annexin A6, partial [Sarracenia purpurea var. burkii]
DPFDPDKDAEIVWKAVDRWGTDEDDINKVLCKRTFKQRTLIATAFEGKSKGQAILAIDLHDTIAGKRDEDKESSTVTEIVCGTDAYDKALLGAYYMQTYNMDVMDDVKKYKAGDELYQSVLFEFCWSDAPATPTPAPPAPPTCPAPGPPPNPEDKPSIKLDKFDVFKDADKLCDEIHKQAIEDEKTKNNEDDVITQTICSATNKEKADLIREYPDLPKVLDDYGAKGGEGYKALLTGACLKERKEIPDPSVTPECIEGAATELKTKNGPEFVAKLKEIIGKFGDPELKKIFLRFAELQQDSDLADKIQKSFQGKEMEAYLVFG